MFGEFRNDFVSLGTPPCYVLICRFAGLIVSFSSLVVIPKHSLVCECFNTHILRPRYFLGFKDDQAMGSERSPRRQQHHQQQGSSSEVLSNIDWVRNKILLTLNVPAIS